MRCRSLLVLAALSGGAAAVLRGRGASLASSLEATGDWSTYLQAEAEDRSFLLSQLDDTESELLRLDQLAQAGRPSSEFAGLQISASPVKANASAAPVKANASAAPVKANASAAPAATKAAKTDVAKKTAAEKDMDPAKLLASVGMKGLKSKLQGSAALAPMLAMLKGMYQDSKDRIAQSNAREEKSKKWFAAKEEEHKAKLAQIEGKFKNHTLSEEFRTNETRDETRYFSYWSRCRERQHRQFHTNLKIQHAMMMKTKKMVEMYEKALSSKASDQAQAKKQLSQMTGMPEIVFLQDANRVVRSFCSESLAEVRKEREAMRAWAQEGLA